MPGKQIQRAADPDGDAAGRLPLWWRLRARLSGRTDTEHEQVLVRVAIGVAIVSGLVIAAVGDPSAAPGRAAVGHRDLVPRRWRAVARPSPGGPGAAPCAALRRDGARYARPDHGVADRPGHGGAVLPILSVDHVGHGVPLWPELPARLGGEQPAQLRPGHRDDGLLAHAAGARRRAVGGLAGAAGLRPVALDQADRCLGPRRRGQSSQEPLSGHHEPRAAHAAARDHRHGRSASGEPVARRAAGHDPHGSQRRADVAGDDRRSSGRRQDRIRHDDGAARALRSACPAGDGACVAASPGAR